MSLAKPPYISKMKLPRSSLLIALYLAVTRSKFARLKTRRGDRLAARREHGTLAITILGVDHVIAMSRTAKAENLLLG